MRTQPNPLARVHPADQLWRWRRGLRRPWQRALPTLKVVCGLAAALVVAALLDHLLSYVLPLPFDLWGGTERVCVQHTIGCELSTHLLGDAVVALIGYGLFMLTQSRTGRQWRRRMKSAPTELFTWLGRIEGGLIGLAAASAVTPPRRWERLWRSATGRPIPSPVVESIVGRDALVQELAGELEAGTEPQLIVGESAAGKTMVLVKLADTLARRRLIPVPISMRGRKETEGKELDFEALALEVFRSRSVGVTREQLDKRWAELQHRGKVVVLVDDLERASGSPRKIAEALEAARRRQLRIVAASRPYGIPADFKRGRTDLPALTADEVEADLDKCMDKPAGGETSDRQFIADLVSDAGLASTPYYLSLARALARHKRLRPRPAGADGRLWLLSEYRKALAAGDLLPRSGVTPAGAADALADLEAVAYIRLLDVSSESRIDAELQSRGWGRIDLPLTLAIARRLGVIDTRHDDRVRFAHPTTLAYLGSQFLAVRTDPLDLWDALIDAGWSPFRSLTLIFAAITTNDGTVSQHICTRLLAQLQVQVDDPRDDATASWLATAAEIVTIGRGVSRDTACEIVEEIRARLDRAVTRGREHAGLLRALGRISEKFELAEGYGLLFRYSTESDYAFRRQATRELASSDLPGEILKPTIDDSIARGRSLEMQIDDGSVPRISDDRGHLRPYGRVFDQLRAVAWILPSLRTAMEEDPMRQTLDEQQEELLRMAYSLSDQRGLEAAIAQGLKFDAVRKPKAAPDPFAARLLAPGEDQATFWYSRVLLVQAVTRRCLGARPSPPHELVTLLDGAVEDDHVFVREMASVCRHALGDDHPERFVFEDLTEVTSRAPFELDHSVSRLIGEMVIALNLNEYGAAASRVHFGNAGAMPACMTAAVSRQRIVELDVTRPDCPFAQYAETGCLCPYALDMPAGASRRELSRAFCRHQRLHIRHLPWNRSMRAADLERFWTEMEDRARF